MTSVDAELDRMLRGFLDEDRGTGDVTTQALVPADATARARIVAKQAGVLSGIDVAARVFELAGDGARFERLLEDGTVLNPGDDVARIEGPAPVLLVAERTALNLLQRMSGIATLTRQYVDAMAGTPAVLLETRKTAPGLRRFDKQAVRDGGGQNHRQGLHDQVLIKENHVAMVAPSEGSGAAGARPIERAVTQARGASTDGMMVEIEVMDLDEARRAATAGADVILLDNFSVVQVDEAVRELSGFPAVQLEASGGIHLGNVAEYAATGVHRISVGAVTHSAPALDLSMLFEGL